MYNCFSFPYHAEMAFLQDAINEFPSDLSDGAKDMLVETLLSQGVETHADLQYITEVDLLSALRPIQARKAVAAWKGKCKYDAVSYPKRNIRLV